MEAVVANAPPAFFFLLKSNFLLLSYRRAHEKQKYFLNDCLGGVETEKRK